MPITIIAAAGTYLLMVAGYFLPRIRPLHIAVMLAVIAFDLGMPLYLYTHRNWYHRLIEQEDITSFLVWMHLGLLVGMYVLEAMQILTARKMLRGDKAARTDHRLQAQMLLLARALVIVTGAILANPGEAAASAVAATAVLAITA